MQLRSIACAAMAALPLAACSAQVDRERQIRAPAITAVGEAENCISTSRIDHTEVHDDYTVDFVMVNDDRLRNTLPSRCFSLGFEKRFAYETPTGRLCSQDTIRVLYAGGDTGAVCGLGTFLPVKLVEEG